MSSWYLSVVLKSLSILQNIVLYFCSSDNWKYLPRSALTSIFNKSSGSSGFLVHGGELTLISGITEDLNFCISFSNVQINLVVVLLIINVFHSLWNPRSVYHFSFIKWLFFSFLTLMTVLLMALSDHHVFHSMYIFTFTYGVFVFFFYIM